MSAESASKLTIPLCPNKELCGSCGWSHIDYEEQLKTKLGEIQKALSNVNAENTCSEILPSPRTSHYRNRMDFTIDFEGRLGLRQKGKWWRTIDGHHCFISHENIEKAFDTVHHWLPETGLSYFDRKKHTGLLRYASIRATSAGDTLVTILTSEPGDEAQRLEEALQQLALSPDITSLVHGINRTPSDNTEAEVLIPIKGDGVIIEHIGEHKYIIDPLSFFQSNSFAAPLLLNQVTGYAKRFPNKSIVDLYCGSGFFTLPLAKTLPAQEQYRVLGIEIVEKAIELAGQNAALNEVSPRFEAAKSEESLWEELRPELLVVDPPRSGTHPRALKKILEAAPEAIIYVSCNHKEFSKDLSKLQEFYAFEESIALDMFPHTPHVELVSLLVRK